jgi:hypothetical protein
MATTTVDYAGQVLTDVRRQIAVDDDVLSVTMTRRNLVKRHARSFPGALKTFDSGSVAHGNVNKPVSDADCGVVLDRRKYQELAPTATMCPRTRSWSRWPSTKMEADGRWIPNTEAECWDASDPEEHTRLGRLGGRSEGSSGLRWAWPRLVEHPNTWLIAALRGLD